MCLPSTTQRRRAEITKLQGAMKPGLRDDLVSSGRSNGIGSHIDDPIDRLNFIAHDIAKTNPPGPEFKLLLRKPTSFWESPAWCVPMGMANPIVYQHRFTWLFVLHALHACYWIWQFIQSGEHTWWLWPAVIVPLSWAFGDFYGGVLHVVLDTPSNIAKPILGLPSLEFQLHHAIPQDIVVKGIMEVCSDLNTVATWNMGITALSSGCNPLAMAITGTTLLAAYCGQASHQATHKLPKNNSAFVKFLQNNNIFLHPRVHRSHHQTHDKDFCILSGWCNPIITGMLNVLPQSHDKVWMWTFLGLTLFGSPLLTSAVRATFSAFL